MSETQWPEVAHDGDTIAPAQQIVGGDEEGLPPPGTVIGAYRLEHILGSGGMGHVWRATHIKLGRPVALKMLRRRYARNVNAVRRFFGEARAVNHIRHDNIIDVTDFIESDGVSAYVMELLEGQSLATLVELGALPVARVLDVAGQIAHAMAAVHAAGVVHRDLKPDNIFLIASNGRRDVVKLLDFGVARLGTVLDGVSTNAGEIFGTPAYMAPEQFGGRSVDHRVDIYAFGVILHELLTGTRPFPQRSLGDLAVAHMTTAPPPLGDDVPAGLRALVAACLEKSAEARPADMQAVLASLREPAALLAAPRVSTTVAGPRRGSSVKRVVAVAGFGGLAVAAIAVAVLIGAGSSLQSGAVGTPPIAAAPPTPTSAAPAPAPTPEPAPAPAPAQSPFPTPVLTTTATATATSPAAPLVSRPRAKPPRSTKASQEGRSVRGPAGSERSTILSPFGT